MAGMINKQVLSLYHIMTGIMALRKQSIAQPFDFIFTLLHLSLDSRRYGIVCTRCVVCIQLYKKQYTFILKTKYFIKNSTLFLKNKILYKNSTLLS